MSPSFTTKPFPSVALPSLVTDEQLSNIKRTLQDHFCDGVVVIVGSGLSCGEGLPGMGTLVDWLDKLDVSDIKRISVKEWTQIIREMKVSGIEAALKFTGISDEVSNLIRTQIAACVLEAEQKVIKDVVTGKKVLKFSRLLKHLPQNKRFTVITTNYDRLIELAAESADFLVDTRSRGNHFAPFSKYGGAYAYARDVVQLKGSQRGHRKIEDHVFSLYKPHGSLDWVDYKGSPVRCAFNVDCDASLIITPGIEKYRAGYNQPFDIHRELANDAIDKATKLLLIGYGFNDDHLETHLSQKIKSGTRTLMMTYKLTDNAKSVLKKTPLSIWAVESASPGDDDGTLVYNNNSIHYIKGERLWDTEGLVKGAFEL